MLKYFFAIFAFLVLVILAMAGLRGQKSARPPIEIFPDMDRQPKVKAQVRERHSSPMVAPPARRWKAPCPWVTPCRCTSRSDGSTGLNLSPYKNIQLRAMLSDYADTGKMGENWGTGIPFGVDEKTS